MKRSAQVGGPGQRTPVDIAAIAITVFAVFSSSFSSTSNRGVKSDRFCVFGGTHVCSLAISPATVLGPTVSFLGRPQRAPRGFLRPDLVRLFRRSRASRSLGRSVRLPRP